MYLEIKNIKKECQGKVQSAILVKKTDTTIVTCTKVRRQALKEELRFSIPGIGLNRACGLAVSSGCGLGGRHRLITGGGTGSRVCMGTGRGLWDCGTNPGGRYE